MDQDVVAARTIVTSNRYLTLATADRDGRPWVSPVWFASIAYRHFLWVSSPEAQHSHNIAGRREVALVIFDSTVLPSAAAAVYIAAHAEAVPDSELEPALAAYSSESVRQGLAVWDEPSVRAPARHRLYRATAIETFVLTSTDERRAVEIAEGAEQ